MSNSEKKNKLYGVFTIELIKFLLIGGISTAVDYIIYSCLVLRLNIILAKFLSMVCSAFLAFLFNRTWTFHCIGKGWLARLGKYYLAQAANIVINVCTNALLFKLTARRGIAFIGATAIAMSVNFLLQKFYVFRRKS